jgi:hypothetical protein
MSQTPKEQIMELMVEVFRIIEESNINDKPINTNEYITIANLFKDMNINLERLNQIKSELISNRYYQQNIRVNQNRIQTLTEEQKRLSDKYILCECGRYCKNNQKFINLHYETKVHIDGLRNRKYSAKISSVKINPLIEREIMLSAVCYKHLNIIKENSEIL